ncbi:hypothetical protein HPB52_024480 [Rhipicephalus sanguineus]|uniref:C3H1-type domain-containing protein n=1 Tax=Rhipicephalus sanguineus TaxID=34632 RepID=A0A9D4SMH8_RHISA|nr:hypothetical protein HPB52_024480 [Rhipicephalus sanguineus]
MSQGAAGYTERDTHDAVGVDPQASTRSRRLQQEPAVHSDKTGKSEDAPNRGLKSAVRAPFSRRRGFPRRTNGPGNAPESVPCKFFSRDGHCRNGDRCRYSHSLEDPSSAATSATTDKPVEREVADVVPDDCTDKSVQRPLPKEPCRFFERHGFCRYGRGCRYAHKRRRDQHQVKSTTSRVPRETTMNDSPKQESDVLNPSASDQTPAGAVSEVENGGSEQQPPSEEELLKQLRDREIDQFRKRFRKSKKVPAGDGIDKYIFVFGPTDPDWVKKIQLAEAAGLEFVPFEQLAGTTAEGAAPTVDETLPGEERHRGEFRRLELGEGVATLECTKVAVRVQCGRCRCNADVVTPARRRNVVTCGRCSRTCSVTFRPNLMHPFNSVLGYFDLVDCFAVDLVLSGCVFALDCFGCNKRMTADGIHYGQRRSLWCQFCNAKMTVLMESVKFLQLQASKAAENAGSAFSIKAPKMVKNVKDPAIQEGKPFQMEAFASTTRRAFAG